MPCLVTFHASTPAAPTAEPAAKTSPHKFIYLRNDATIGNILHIVRNIINHFFSTFSKFGCVHFDDQNEQKKLFQLHAVSRAASHCCRGEHATLCRHTQLRLSNYTFRGKSAFSVTRSGKFGGGKLLHICLWLSTSLLRQWKMLPESAIGTRDITADLKLQSLSFQPANNDHVVNLFGL